MDSQISQGVLHHQDSFWRAGLGARLDDGSRVDVLCVLCHRYWRQKRTAGRLTIVVFLMRFSGSHVRSYTRRGPNIETHKPRRTHPAAQSPSWVRIANFVGDDHSFPGFLNQPYARTVGGDVEHRSGNLTAYNQLYPPLRNMAYRNMYGSVMDV